MHTKLNVVPLSPSCALQMSPKTSLLLLARNNSSIEHIPKSNKGYIKGEQRERKEALHDILGKFRLTLKRQLYSLGCIDNGNEFFRYSQFHCRKVSEINIRQQYIMESDKCSNNQQDRKQANKPPTNQLTD